MRRRWRRSPLSEAWDLHRSEVGAALFLLCCAVAFVMLIFGATVAVYGWLAVPVGIALWIYEGGDG